jgi:hypothetical protein
LLLLKKRRRGEEKMQLWIYEIVAAFDTKRTWKKGRPGCEWIRQKNSTTSPFQPPWVWHAVLSGCVVFYPLSWLNYIPMCILGILLALLDTLCTTYIGNPRALCSTLISPLYSLTYYIDVIFFYMSQSTIIHLSLRSYRCM